MDESPLTLVHVYSPKTVLLLWVMDAVWLYPQGSLDLARPVSKLVYKLFGPKPA